MSDPINHPDHYTMGGIEVNAKQLSLHIGQVHVLVEFHAP